jgi:tRNA (guanine37-N1)-methyltransferase
MKCITVLTLYPDAFRAFMERGVVGRYIASGAVQMRVQSIRDFADPPHYKVDDYPYSNRKSMVLRYDVLQRAIHAQGASARLIMPDPGGKVFDHRAASALANDDEMVFISPAFEGVDARFMQTYPVDCYSMGDFIVTNGDAPVAIMVEAILRYMPGVVGCADCVMDDSILSGLLEFPQYCSPQVVDNRAVPDILLSGNHAAISAWKTEQQLRRTLYMRPDLINEFPFSESLGTIIDQIVLEDTQ